MCLTLNNILLYTQIEGFFYIFKKFQLILLNKKVVVNKMHIHDIMYC